MGGDLLNRNVRDHSHELRNLGLALDMCVCVYVCVLWWLRFGRGPIYLRGAGPGFRDSGFFHAIGSGSGALRDSFERPPEWGQWEGAWVKPRPQTRLALGV